jgi:hypothetical protein
MAGRRKVWMFRPVALVREPGLSIEVAAIRRALDVMPRSIAHDPSNLPSLPIFESAIPGPLPSLSFLS